MKTNFNKLNFTKSYLTAFLFAALQLVVLPLQAQQNAQQTACFQWVDWKGYGPNPGLPLSSQSSPADSTFTTIGGIVGDRYVTYTSTQNILYRTGLHVSNSAASHYNPFYQVPVGQNFIANTQATTNVLSFDLDTQNPVLVFESIGNSTEPVSIIFQPKPLTDGITVPKIKLEYLSMKRMYDYSNPPTTCDSSNTPPDITLAEYNAAISGSDVKTAYGSMFTSLPSSACIIKIKDASNNYVGLIAKEGFVIVKVTGVHKAVQFDYSAENYVQFVFGYDPSICGNGHLECGEQCDLGGPGATCEATYGVGSINCQGRNGDINAPGLACDTNCTAMQGSECSGMEDLENWMTNDPDSFDNLIGQIVNTTCLAADNCSSNTLTEAQIENLRGQSNYLIAYNANCTGSGLEGDYEKLTLTSNDTNITREIIFRCTNSNIRTFDRQMLSKLAPRVYNDQTTDCGAGSVPVSNLLLDGEVKSCKLHCDDNTNCTSAVQTTDANGNKKCKLYSSCSPSGTATRYQLSI